MTSHPTKQVQQQCPKRLNDLARNKIPHLAFFAPPGNLSSQGSRCSPARTLPQRMVTILLVAAVGTLDVSGTVRPLIFIHVQKTGGTSIEETLGIANEWTNGSTPECQGVPFVPKLFDKHDTATTAKAYYTDAEWTAAFKFSIIRNPWDRLVSYWAFTTTVGRHDDSNLESLMQCGCANTTMPASRSPSPMGALQPEELNSDPSIGDDAYYCPFSRFIQTCISLQEFLVSDVLVQDWWYEPNPNRSGSGLIDQLEWLIDDVSRAAGVSELSPKDSLVDFVGRTENLTAHFEEALIRAGKSLCARLAPRLAPACIYLSVAASYVL